MDAATPITNFNDFERYLDPINKAAVEQYIASGTPPFKDLSVQQLRKVVQELQQHTPLPGVRADSFLVPLEDGRAVRTVLFRPQNAKDPLPVIFYVHGGAWLVGSEVIFDSICRDIAFQSGCAVIFIEYSLAPERKFPVQIEECYAVVKYIFKYGQNKNLLVDKFGIVADSAGGQIAMATMLLSQSRLPELPFASVALLAPLVNTSGENRETLSEFEFFDDPFAGATFIEHARNFYIPKQTDRLTELGSPLLMSKEKASKLPPTLVVVNSGDPFRTDGEQFAKLLQEAGVDCVLFRAEGQIHDSMVLEATRKSPTARQVVSMVSHQLRDALFDKKEAA